MFPACRIYEKILISQDSLFQSLVIQILIKLKVAVLQASSHKISPCIVPVASSSVKENPAHQ